MLTPYLRGAIWWAKGRVEYNGRPIGGYVRESTGASDERGARDWIAEREDSERRRHLLGEQAAERPLTFNAALLLYEPPEPTIARYLIPLQRELGPLACKDITPKMIRDLGPKLYPDNSTDSWRRWVITPARAVINNANELGKCPPIRVKGYDKEERIKQDKKRGKWSRVKKTPGSWDWLLKFYQEAPARLGTLALFMFSTGARIGQCCEMHPQKHLKLQEGKAIIPGAKGHEDREVQLAPELIAELANLSAKTPRGWDRSDKRNLRVFGYASNCGPLKAWKSTCDRAKIPYLPPHSAGRHGFGQEMLIRNKVDKKAVEAIGGWSAQGNMLDRTYTHAENENGKILRAFRTGRVQAEKRTGIKLLRNGAKS